MPGTRPFFGCAHPRQGFLDLGAQALHLKRARAQVGGDGKVGLGRADSHPVIFLRGQAYGDARTLAERGGRFSGRESAGEGPAALRAESTALTWRRWLRDMAAERIPVRGCIARGSSKHVRNSAPRRRRPGRQDRAPAGTSAEARHIPQAVPRRNSRLDAALLGLPFPCCKGY